MKNQTALITLGVLVVLLPFSGIPGSWRNILCVVFGISIVGIASYNKRSLKNVL